MSVRLSCCSVASLAKVQHATSRLRSGFAARSHSSGQTLQPAIPPGMWHTFFSLHTQTVNKEWKAAPTAPLLTYTHINTLEDIVSFIHSTTLVQTELSWMYWHEIGCKHSWLKTSSYKHDGSAKLSVKMNCRTKYSLALLFLAFHKKGISEILLILTNEKVKQSLDGVLVL